MSINKYNATTGSLEAISQGRVWVGTKAEWEATVQSGSYPKNVLVAITDDETEVNAVDVTSQLTNTSNCNIINAYKLGNLLFVMGETKNTVGTSGNLFDFSAIGESAIMYGRAPMGSVSGNAGQVTWAQNSSTMSIASFAGNTADNFKFNFVIPLA